ncbi:unnamed protein product [Owenia fusiformis]|uniref:Uncharacterized protein n=1 Tax=Owenia fusiformis TaxID=6347 RepID=A0A8S4P079_OWEFU|nr:unnamed protein product [Owenia fusiformis]
MVQISRSTFYQNNATKGTFLFLSETMQCFRRGSFTIAKNNGCLGTEPATLDENYSYMLGVWESFPRESRSIRNDPNFPCECRFNVQKAENNFQVIKTKF